MKYFSNNYLKYVCITAWKVAKYGVFSGPYFPAFELNTERYEVSLLIQSECGKIRTRKYSVFGYFSHSVFCCMKAWINIFLVLQILIVIIQTKIFPADVYLYLLKICAKFLGKLTRNQKVQGKKRPPMNKYTFIEVPNLYLKFWSTI